MRSKIRSLIAEFKIASNQFKHQYAYEIHDVFTCSKTGHHIIEVKLSGKSQSTPYLAEEIVVDNNFLLRFSPSDIRTITYLATSDRYETILREEKIKKSYEIIRNRNRNGKKTIQLRNVLTNEIQVVPLCDFANDEIIENLTSKDAYYIGYLAGQEQTWKDCMRLKLISGKEQDQCNE